jgi:S-DNA-T family DNA segregation ATPase FtsK/SpoIIIE
MARPKKKPAKKVVEKAEPAAPLLKTETLHGILAVACFAAALFFILAATPYAGTAGDLTYGFFAKMFGTGFYAIPIVLALLGISFIRLVRPNFVMVRLVAGLVSFIAFLAIISTVFHNSSSVSGGAIGTAIANPLTQLFNIYSLVLLFALIIISQLVLFDTHIRRHWFTPWRYFRRAEIGEEEVDVTLAPDALTPALETAPVLAAAKEEELKTESKPLKTTEAPTEEESIFSRLTSFGGKRSYNTEFTPPPLNLLEHDSGKPGAGDIKANANIIKRTLQNFGIMVEMDEVSIGPSITRYALKPAEGVKLSRILALQNDLSLALAAHPIRIEAPIPGKSLVGIEIPNRTKSIVGLASLIGSKEFSESPNPLMVSLGRGITGISHFANVAKAPHLLIAGTTGSGKSVVIHTFITSLLYRNAPDQLRFIMIDPKRVELTLYNKIPHLLTPVVTDPKKAIMVLKWAIKEMERRYNLLEQHTVRDIQSYHKNILEPAYSQVSGRTLTPEEETALPEKMPYIVVIIDELADIMSTYPRELEAAIVRLAQMSRAIGIHLVLSTQRPSVEVITGLIKANIPTRIALQVASQIDSRTILDMAGAEKLLGSGDMLYLSGEMSKPNRLQSAFISEDEVKKVVGYLATNYGDQAADELALNTAEAGPFTSVDLEDDGGDEGDDDELYEEAREIVIKAGKASASYLQRKLKVGYARAARLLDMLEERGVIGPGEGAKQREVYEKDAAPTDF